MNIQTLKGSAGKTAGKGQALLGRLIGDRKVELDGQLTEVKGKARETYGQVIDGLDELVAKVPAEYQDYGRRGVDFARRKPLLTTGIVAGVLAVLLGSLSRRR